MVHGLNPWSEKIPQVSEQLSPCITNTEARVPRVHALQQEKPLKWETSALQPRVVPALSS